MSIIITNMGPTSPKEGADTGGERNYQLRVNDEIITTFHHSRRNGLAQCLRLAAEAADKAKHEPEPQPDGWRAITRETGLIEWVCPHGVGHPAPVQYQFTDVLRSMGDSWGVHGCDGCCHALRKQENKR